MLAVLLPMRSRKILRMSGVVCPIALLAALMVWTTAPSGAQTATAIWERIDYPSVQIPAAGQEQMTLLVSSGGRQREPSHLRLDLLWAGRSNSVEDIPKPIADAAAIVVRLHTAAGAVTTAQQAPSWAGAGTGGVTWSLIWTFPWGRNALDEAWFELNAAGRRYWIELPYGFARNPTDPEVADTVRGRPQFPGTMKVAINDVLVPWLRVVHDLGEIRNRWRLTLEIANPFDANAETILYRDDFQVGKSRYLWSLETPRLAMELHRPDARATTALRTAIRLHDDGMRRSDAFSFGRDGSPDEGRIFGTAMVRIDATAFSVRVPSSLFKYLHGVTDPANAQRLPRR